MSFMHKEFNSIVMQKTDCNNANDCYHGHNVGIAPDDKTEHLHLVQ